MNRKSLNPFQILEERMISYLAVIFREFLIGADDLVEISVHELRGDVDIIESMSLRRWDDVSNGNYL